MKSPKKILNPQALHFLYGGFPCLDGVEIIEFFLKRDEPLVLMKIMVKSKPINVPARWPESYDVVYFDLSFIGARKMTVSGWSCTNIADRFDIKEADDLVSVRALGERGFSILFDCDWIAVDSLVPGIIGSP